MSIDTQSRWKKIQIHWFLEEKRRIRPTCCADLGKIKLLEDLVPYLPERRYHERDSPQGEWALGSYSMPAPASRVWQESLVYQSISTDSLLCIHLRILPADCVRQKASHIGISDQEQCESNTFANYSIEQHCLTCCAGIHSVYRNCERNTSCMSFQIKERQVWVWPC